MKTSKTNDNPPPQPPGVATTFSYSGSIISDLFGCFFGHSWTKWKTIVNQQYGFMDWQIVQERTCQCCDKKEIKNEIIDG